MKHQGVFITLEGIDFCGKSTQADMLVRHLKECGQEPLFLREPGGTALSEKVREILLNRGDVDVTDRAELLLFLAARTQLVDEVIMPAIESGRIVICDRFYDSTYAYQGYARGLPLDIVTDMNSFATYGLVPDLTLLYDLAVEVARRRGTATVPAHDRLEKETSDFHKRVREGYLELASRDPDRIRVIDAEPDPAEVWKRTWELTWQSLSEHGIELHEK
jgi:dTMP kinase